MKQIVLGAVVLALTLAGCATKSQEAAPEASGPQAAAAPTYFKVEPATAGSISGKVLFTGRRPKLPAIDLSSDADCAKLHPGGKLPDDAVAVGKGGELANTFLYLKSGLEGKQFAVPAEAVTIDQRGCHFAPRVFGVQTGQTIRVTNSDGVTHNIHPEPANNREWNQSQAPEEPPVTRKFARPEVMIRVKCNVHRWMRAWIGVVDHPYFTVTPADGTFALRNVPPGTYTLTAWHERFGSQEQTITVGPSSTQNVEIKFKGE